MVCNDLQADREGDKISSMSEAAERHTDTLIATSIIAAAMVLCGVYAAVMYCRKHRKHGNIDKQEPYQISKLPDDGSEDDTVDAKGSKGKKAGSEQVLQHTQHTPQHSMNPESAQADPVSPGYKTMFHSATSDVCISQVLSLAEQFT